MSDRKMRGLLCILAVGGQLYLLASAWLLPIVSEYDLVRRVVSLLPVPCGTLRYACSAAWVCGTVIVNGSRAGLRSSTIQAGLAQRARIVLLAADGLTQRGDRGPGRGVASDGDQLACPLRAQRHRRARPIEARSGRPRIDRPPQDRGRHVAAAAEEARRDALVEPVAWRPSGDRGRHRRPGVAGVRASRPGGVRRSSSPPTPNWSPRSPTSSGSIWPRRRTRSCCAWTRSPRSKRWTGPRRCCRMQPGLPERRTHDYVRHGTTTLFAALNIATGTVTARCQPRHRHQEFLRFLKQVARAYPDQRAASGDGQLRRPQAGRDPRLAGRQPAGAGALHPDLGVVDEPGRSVVRDHRTPSHPPRQLRQRHRPHPRASAPSSTAEEESGDNISELVLGRSGGVQALAFLVSGLAAFGLAYVLVRSTRGWRGSAFGSALLLVNGLGLIVAALVPTDRVDSPADLADLSPGGLVHVSAAALGLVSAVLGHVRLEPGLRPGLHLASGGDLVGAVGRWLVGVAVRAESGPVGRAYATAIGNAGRGVDDHGCDSGADRARGTRVPRRPRVDHPRDPGRLSLGRR